MNVLQSAITTTLFLPMLFGCGGGEMNTVELNTSGEVTNANFIIQRQNGIWAALDQGFVDTGTGSVRVIRVLVDGRVVAGGRDLVSANGVTVNNIAIWDGVAWDNLGDGLNDRVTGIEIMPNGDLIICGYFTDVAGGAGGTYSHVVGYSFTTGYYALGAGLDNDVWGMAVDGLGNVYFTGTFTDVVGGPTGTYNRIVKWNGTAYSALGTGLNNTGNKLAVDANNNVYVTGYFTTANSVTVNYVAMWNGTTFVALGSGMGSTAAGIAIANNGIVYVSGNTTDFGGVTANYIAAWNGTAWAPLGSGLTASSSLKYDKGSGLLYASSPYVATLNGLSIWNGSTWYTSDVDLPGSATVFAIGYDATRLFVGFDTEGTATTSGIGVTDINNTGSTDVYPRFIITRAGGTSATLLGIYNKTTGKQLLFNWPLLDGEEVVIDLTPGRKTITSSFSGNALNKLLDANDFGSFRLLPGVNSIGLYILAVGSPTLTAFIQWETQFASLDGAAS